MTVPPDLEVVTDGALVLRAFDGGDVDRLAAAFADEQIRAWNPGPDARDEIEDWVGRRNDWSSGEHASWAVSDDDRQLLGSVSLHQIDPDQRDAEIGYWVAPWARRRQVALRAVLLATRYAFERIGLRRVYLFHAVDNEPSCRLAVRAGFPQEGLLRESHRYADGRWHDEHLHARLATDPWD